MAVALQWGETPQRAREPGPEGVCRAGNNSGLTRKTRTMPGTENGARPLLPKTNNRLGPVFGGQVMMVLPTFCRNRSLVTEEIGCKAISYCAHE